MQEDPPVPTDADLKIEEVRPLSCWQGIRVGAWVCFCGCTLSLSPQRNIDRLKNNLPVAPLQYPKWTVYVRTFGGFATAGTIIKGAQGFQDVLKADDRGYNAGLVWVAVYDPPQKLINRHNELHIMASEKKAVAPKLGRASIITAS